MRIAVVVGLIASLSLACGGPDVRERKAPPPIDLGVADEGDLPGTVKMFQQKLDNTKPDHEHYPLIIERLALAHMEYADDLAKTQETAPSPDAATKEREQRKLAIQRFEQLVTDFPAAEGTPSAMFLLAFEYDKMGQPDEGFRVRVALVQAHPDTRWAAEVMLGLGDTYFEQADMTKAGEAYEGFIAANPDHQGVVYAQYKLGWVHFNTQAWADAFALFKGIGHNPLVKPEMRYQAQLDAVMAIAQLAPDAAAAQTHIAELTDDPAVRAKLVDNLAELWRSSGRDADADAL